MKNTNTCPKCQSKDIIRIEGGSGGDYEDRIQTGAFIWNYIPVTRFVCGVCGFTEEWIVNREMIDRLRNKFC